MEKWSVSLVNGFWQTQGGIFLEGADSGYPLETRTDTHTHTHTHTHTQTDTDTDTHTLPEGIVKKERS